MPDEQDPWYGRHQQEYMQERMSRIEGKVERIDGEVGRLRNDLVQEGKTLRRDLNTEVREIEYRLRDQLRADVKESIQESVTQIREIMQLEIRELKSKFAELVPFIRKVWMIVGGVGVLVALAMLLRDLVIKKLAGP